MTNFSLSRKGKKPIVRTNLRDLFKCSPSTLSVNHPYPSQAKAASATNLSVSEFGHFQSKSRSPNFSTTDITIPLAGLRARSNSLDLDGWPARSSSTVGYEVKPAQAGSEEPDARFGYLWCVPLAEGVVLPPPQSTPSVTRSSLKSRLFGNKRAAKVTEEPKDTPLCLTVGDSGRKYMTLPANRKLPGTSVGEIWSVAPLEQEDEILTSRTEKVEEEMIHVPASTNSEPPQTPTHFPPLPPAPIITVQQPIEFLPPPTPASWFSSSSTATVVAQDVSIEKYEIDRQRSMEDMQRAYSRMCEMTQATTGEADSKEASRQSLTFDTLDSALQTAVSENISAARPVTPLATPVIAQATPVISQAEQENRPVSIDVKTDNKLEKLQEAARAVSSPRRARAFTIKQGTSASAPCTPTKPARRVPTTEPRTPTRSVRIVEPTSKRSGTQAALGLGRPPSLPALKGETPRLSSFSYLDVPAGASPDVELERQNDMMVVLLLRKMAERDEENKKLRERISELEKEDKCRA